MKKILCLMTIALMGVVACAQTVTLTFTGRDAAEHWIQLNRVVITNLTKGWQETIYWPDTTSTMQIGTGIDESVAKGGFALSQNNPNPFTGTTDVNLTVTDAGAVTLEIVDGNGKIVETRHGTSLQPGTHQFRVSLSAAGTYVMTARQNGKTSSIKMVCNGGGNGNRIEYIGMVQPIMYILKSTTTAPFDLGDQMEYVGYATINGTEMESLSITQAQNASQTFVLQFAAVQHTIPTVTTNSATNIGATYATVGGMVTSDGGASVTARGVCWNTTGNPTVADSKTTDGSGIGNFTSILTGLIAGTTYYVRAYATNSVGTAYGVQRSFTTLSIPQPCPGTPTVTDIDGNTYNTVQIGQQCWMKENLRTTKYADNTDIEYGTGASYSNAYWSYPNNDASNKFTYGLLYNWKAVMRDATSSNANPSGVQGICPTGWHVPSDAEWTQLTDYVSSQSQFVCGSTSIAKALAGTTGWNSSTNTCAVGNTPSSNNATGFSALPAGESYSSTFYGCAYFWSATGANSTEATYRVLFSQLEFVHREFKEKHTGMSVRCVHDGNTSQAVLTVTTNAVTNIADSSAICGGNVIHDGGSTVIARGVCWGMEHNPTVNISHTTDGSGTGSFTSSLTELIPGATIYVRAYATNSVETAYGNEVSFTTTLLHWSPCEPTITDIDGNTYNIVQIGTQCWMKENLRTTRYADSTPISQGSTYSTDTAYWYYPDGNSSNEATYGLLYNWKAVMRDATSSSANPSGVQGICPNGWHVPSDAEWKQMEMAVGMSQSDADDMEYRGNIAAQLCGNTGWQLSTVPNAAGNISAPGRDSSGFSALPAGCYSSGYYSGGYYGGCVGFGYDAFFWSTTEFSSTTAYHRRLLHDAAEVCRNYRGRSNGCSVRCLRGEGTVRVPTVTTAAVTNISSTSANFGGNVTNDGGATVTARGVCWSTSHNPTISGSHTTIGSGTGNFTSNITGLAPYTTYYVRAYATNSAGTAYGNEESFITLVLVPPCPGVPTLTDIDGNIYNTVLIGTQCWMRENLKTTKYADGTSIWSGGSSSTSTTTAYWYYPNNSSSNKATYGLLYNWKAVMRNSYSSFANPSGVQGICPNGWHVPSDAEWMQLTDYVSSQSQYVCGSDNTYIAKALSGTTGWNSSTDTNTCAVGNTPSNNNTTGFSALPAGGYRGDYCIYYNLGNSTEFWSTTDIYSTDAYVRSLSYNYANVTRSYGNKADGYSVRCVRDSGTVSVSVPTVTTAAVTNITSTSATYGGNVTSDGGATVTARGVCWSTSQNPTISDSHTTNGSGMGNFTSNITGLAPNTTYYVCAYATNSAGMAYGNEVSFTTAPEGNSLDGQPCPGAATLTDIDGNTYNTVQIGQQCWMKENLRTTHYADNTPISQGSETPSTTTAYWYYPNNSSSNMSTYALLYNWKAVMGSSSSSDANPSGVQGICPTGWHVPSDAEWTQLTNYVSSQSQYVCGSDNTYYIAKALAGTTGWISSTNTCAVGDTPSNNNATGFSALPAGRYCGSYYNFGDYAFFWSATEYIGALVNCCRLDYNNADVYTGSDYKRYGFSVRCVRDEGGGDTVSVPTVTTAAVTNITSTFATSGGNVTDDGGATVTTRGVCWSSSQNPTISDSHTTDGSGTGSFTSSLAGLTPNTTYYVRAYATNSAGTAYGNEVSFITAPEGNSQDGQPCPGDTTLTDIDGNTYNTVQIGTQCWMKENLRTKKYANGTSISQGSGTSTTTAYWYYPNDSSSNMSTYGLLYNWKAVMRNYSSSSANPSGVQGICPTGWHVPSDAEWTQLTDYVSSQSQYVCGSDNSYIAKALASNAGWNSGTDTCTVGNTPSNNNATGFSALPAGSNYGVNYNAFGYGARFWSTTEVSSTSAYSRSLANGGAGVGRNGTGKASGYSVRCVKD